MSTTELSKPKQFADDLKGQDLENRYGNLAYAISMLALFLSEPDPDELASSAVVDGGDDKSNDLVVVDEESSTITLCQAYFAPNWDKVVAPSNKAASLQQAWSWLFSAGMEIIPERLRARATEVRESIKAGSIERIQLVFLHNCGESENARRELSTAALAVKATLSTPSIEVNAIEIGIETASVLIESQHQNILVKDDIEVPTQDVLGEGGEGWKAVVFTAPSSWLSDLHAKFGTKLFSANVREYLGSKRDRRNINHGIKTSAETDGKHFWMYNNGLLF